MRNEINFTVGKPGRHHFNQLIKVNHHQNRENKNQVPHVRMQWGENTAPLFAIRLPKVIT